MRIPLDAACLAALGGAASVAAQTPPTPWAVGAPELQVNTTTTDDQMTPSVAFGAANGFIVGWTSDGQDGDGYGVFARRFDKTGAPLSGEFQVNFH